MADGQFLPSGVSKRILYGGTGDLPDYPDGAKVTFHYRTLYERDGKEIILDDTKNIKQPFELLFGKKFKLEIWETLIKSMRVNEVAMFLCDAKLVSVYPMVAKSIRDMNKKKQCGHNHDEEGHAHQCGFAAYSQGLGYPDLDEYVRDPLPLTFILEITKLILPGDYEPDVWSLSLEEKLENIPKWKEEGNSFYKNGDIEKATEMYSQSIGSLEQLMTREKPGTEEWLELEKIKITLLLNYSQCMLSKKDYYQAIQHLCTVLEKDKDNVKALYRRAKSYHLVHDYESSRSDYIRVKELDSKLIKTVDKELAKIEIEAKQKDMEDQKKYMNVFKKL